MIKIIKWTIC